MTDLTLEDFENVKNAIYGKCLPDLYDGPNASSIQMIYVAALTLFAQACSLFLQNNPKQYTLLTHIYIALVTILDELNHLSSPKQKLLNLRNIFFNNNLKLKLFNDDFFSLLQNF